MDLRTKKYYKGYYHDLNKGLINLKKSIFLSQFHV